MARDPLMTTGPVETKLRESQRTLATLMDNLPGMAYRCRNDQDWTMDFVSQGSMDLTGYGPAELIANATISSHVTVSVARSSASRGSHA